MLYRSLPDWTRSWRSFSFCVAWTSYMWMLSQCLRESSVKRKDEETILLSDKEYRQLQWTTLGSWNQTNSGWFSTLRNGCCSWAIHVHSANGNLRVPKSPRIWIAKYGRWPLNEHFEKVSQGRKAGCYPLPWRKSIGTSIEGLRTGMFAMHLDCLSHAYIL